MKKLIFAMMMCLPMAASAQNTWEMPTQANNSDAKYLVGAVPVVDGKVTFKTTVEAPGKTADQVADIVRKYMKKMAFSIEGEYFDFFLHINGLNPFHQLLCSTSGKTNLMK